MGCKPQFVMENVQMVMGHGHIFLYRQTLRKVINVKVYGKENTVISIFNCV
jgi:hypothetical protein